MKGKESAALLWKIATISHDALLKLTFCYELERARVSSLQKFNHAFVSVTDGHILHFFVTALWSGCSHNFLRFE